VGAGSAREEEHAVWLTGGFSDLSLLSLMASSRAEPGPTVGSVVSRRITWPQAADPDLSYWLPRAAPKRAMSALFYGRLAMIAS
jgi:hypothetical protein